MLLYCFSRLGLFWGGGLMVLVPLLLAAIIFFAIYLIIKRPAKRNDNMEILKNRLAKGEITVQEYEELKNHLK